MIDAVVVRDRALALALLGVWAVGLVLVSGGCNRRNSFGESEAASANADSNRASRSARSAGARASAGASCMGRDDCASDQVCVDRHCRFRETSVAGEILATAAQGQIEAGDWEGAMRTYDQAIERFEAQNAPVPPEILCGSASLILRTATEAEQRERGALRADACFRASLPGSIEREEVRRAVARMRFEGLDPTLFDRPDPAERFFTQEASRPTVDAVEIELSLPDTEDAQVTSVLQQLDSESAHHAIAECFLQDWELRHERSALGTVVVRYSTRLRDMGDYDVFEPELSIERTTVAEDGFEPCVAHALSGAITVPRASRVVSWQQQVGISARVQ